VGRDELYAAAAREYGRALDRLAAGYETDAEKRLDLRQEIHFQLWRSLENFDGRCALKTWTFRVAHNTAVSHVTRERRRRAVFVSLEEVETAAGPEAPDIDQARALAHLSELILQLKPLDRQIMLLYLEEMSTAEIAEITGISAGNAGMKIHRIKTILGQRFAKERNHA